MESLNSSEVCRRLCTSGYLYVHFDGHNSAGRTCAPLVALKIFRVPVWPVQYARQPSGVWARATACTGPCCASVLCIGASGSRLRSPSGHVSSLSCLAACEKDLRWPECFA